MQWEFGRYWRLAALQGGHYWGVSLYYRTKGFVVPCAAATSPTHCCEMWLRRQRRIPIVTSQWVFTVTSLDHCLSPHFMNGAVISVLAKQHFVGYKFEQNCRLGILNSDIICFLNTFYVNWHFHLYKSIYQILSLR